jgi:hypothetical protein
MAEVRGEDVLEAEKVAFPSVPGVPAREVYVGPDFNHYSGGDGPDPRGSFHDISRLGRITPGHRANRVVVHGRRHTDWYEGEWAVSDPGEGIVRVDDPGGLRGGVKEIWWDLVGTINPTHMEHATRDVYAFDDFGAASDTL